MKDKSDSLKDQIPDYLDGALEGEKLREFEAALAKDEGLRRAVSFQQQTEANLKEDIKFEKLVQGVEASFENVSSSFENPEKTRQINEARGYNKWWLLAAAIALIPILIFLIKSWSSNPPPGQLLTDYHQNFIAGEILPVDYSSNTRFPADKIEVAIDSLEKTGQDSLLSMARLAFVNGNYESAQALYDNLHTNSIDQGSAASFEYGVLLWANKEYALAERILQDLPTDVGPKRSWYLALAQLGVGDVVAARATLSSLATLKSPYRDRAEYLLGQIK